MSVIDPETDTLPTQDEPMLLSENDLKFEQGLPRINDRIDGGHDDQILVSEMKEKVASKKRKSSKSKRGSKKKVKVASHEDVSVCRFSGGSIFFLLACLLRCFFKFFL